MESVVGRVLATLITIIALAGLGYAAYNGFQTNKVTAMSTGVLSMAQNIGQLEASSLTTNGLISLPAANLSGATSLWAVNPPTGDIGTAGNLIDPWGDSIVVAGHADTGALYTAMTAAEFEVDVAGTNLTPSNCQSLLSSLGSAVVGALSSGTLITAAQLSSPVQVATVCTNDSGSGKTLTLVFND